MGAPRIDKIEVPRESKEDADVVEIEVSLPGATVVPQTEAADRLATFWDRAYTEFNVAKATAVPCTANINPEAYDFEWPCLSKLASNVGVRQSLGVIDE